LDDLDDLIRIENAAFASDRIKRPSFRRLLSSPTAFILVCEQSGKCAGYALVLTRAKSRRARLYSLAVHPDHAGQGLGAELLQRCETLAKSKNARSLGLEVRTDNLTAIALYSACRYEQIGVVAGYYADKRDAYRFSKTL
jgi:ribosomal-protein-alanine acetyltransferase